MPEVRRNGEHFTQPKWALALEVLGIEIGREQPDAQIYSEPGAVREGFPLSQKGDGK